MTTAGGRRGGIRSRRSARWLPPSGGDMLSLPDLRARREFCSSWPSRFMGSADEQQQSKSEGVRRDLVVAFTGEQLQRLKALARRLMGMERADHTLQATALLNELWLKLAHETSPPPESPDGTGYVRL